MRKGGKDGSLGKETESDNRIADFPLEGAADLFLGFFWTVFIKIASRRSKNQFRIASRSAQ
jgi:hypothetical protein